MLVFRVPFFAHDYPIARDVNSPELLQKSEKGCIIVKLSNFSKFRVKSWKINDD